MILYILLLIAAVTLIRGDYCNALSTSTCAAADVINSELDIITNITELDFYEDDDGGDILLNKFNTWIHDNAKVDFYEDDNDILSTNLIQWLRDNGAYINEKLVVKNDGSYRGVFATQDMEAGERVCSIPSYLILQPTTELMENENEVEETDCITIKAVMNAMSKGDNLTPYGEYLAAQPSGYLPSFWSDSGKKVMLKSTGEERLTESRATDYNPLEYDELPPHGVRDMIDELKRDCKAGDDLINDPQYLFASMLVTSRADFDYMIPFYDMFNHDNAKNNIKHDENPHKDDNKREITFSQLGFTVSKPIKVGEELFNTYNHCSVCGDRFDWFGTPEMWLEYGFVESIPQRWLFDFARVKFDLIWKDGDESSGEVVVNFLVPMSLKGKRLLQKELTRLDTFAAIHRHKSYQDYGDMSRFEWESLWQYYDALHNAMMLATTQRGTQSSNDVWTLGHDWWVQDGTLKEEDSEEHYVLRTKSL